jgi:hypothetical protein
MGHSRWFCYLFGVEREAVGKATAQVADFY